MGAGLKRPDNWRWATDAVRWTPLGKKPIRFVKTCRTGSSPSENEK